MGRGGTYINSTSQGNDLEDTLHFVACDDRVNRMLKWREEGAFHNVAVEGKTQLVSNGIPVKLRIRTLI